MQRRRELAGAPARSAAQTCEAICTMLRKTLCASAKVEREELADALTAARPALLALIAGGHLDQHPLVLVASPVHLSVTIISGDRALTLEENLNVPGGSSIEEWTIHLPAPEPLSASVRAAANSHERLSAEQAPGEIQEQATATTLLDRDALAARRSASP